VVSELCASLVLGLHLGTWHAAPGFNGVNPGGQVRCDNLVAGAYYNSYRKPSAYLGYNWPRVVGPVDLTIVAATGYPKAPVLLALVPSIKLESGLRVSFVPSPNRLVSVIHLSWEF